MVEQMVVGLFEAVGTAEDVRNRLIYEGVPASDVELRVLRKVEPLPPSLDLEGHAFGIETFYRSKAWERYRLLIRNGETAVLVRIRSEDELETTVNTMRQYAPIEIDRVAPGEEEPLLRERAVVTDVPR